MDLWAVVALPNPGFIEYWKIAIALPRLLPHEDGDDKKSQSA